VVIDGKMIIAKIMSPNAIKFDDEAASRFLVNYANTGRMADSAHAAGVTYQLVWLRRKENEQFARMVEEARQLFINGLERELYRRGVEGWLEPIVAGKEPEIVTYVRKHSDKCLELLLRRHAPEHYSNKEVATNITVNQAVVIRPEPKTIETTTLPIEDLTDESDSV
jgi:hypothetical protein